MTIHDLTFEKFISEVKIRNKVNALAKQISEDYKDRIPCFLPILNGSFMFASDLLKEIDLQCRVSFVKIASYQGRQSTGKIKTLIGHEESLFNQEITKHPDGVYQNSHSLLALLMALIIKLCTQNRTETK